MSCFTFNLYGSYAPPHGLLKDATKRSKIRCDRYQIQFDVNLYPPLFFANTPLNYGAIHSSKNGSSFPLPEENSVYVNKFSINKLGSGQLFIINYNFLI